MLEVQELRQQPSEQVRGQPAVLRALLQAAPEGQLLPALPGLLPGQRLRQQGMFHSITIPAV